LSDPEPYIGGVKSDSIIHKTEALNKDHLYAKMTRFKKTYRLKILHFELPVLVDTSVVVLNSLGDKFSPEMRRYVQRLKPGIPLNFTNIYCVMPNGKARKLKDMLVFVDCTPKHGFAE
jgi:hypothetical protein